MYQVLGIKYQVRTSRARVGHFGNVSILREEGR